MLTAGEKGGGEGRTLPGMRRRSGCFLLPALSLSARSLLRAVLRCSPDLSVRPARLPPTRSPVANRAAHRPAGGQKDSGATGEFRPSLPASPRGLMQALRGERRPCPGLAGGGQPREGHQHRGAEHGEGPSGTAAVVVTAAGPASAAAGCRAPPGLSPCQCPAAASESECQAAPFPFLPSFLPCLPPLPRCQPFPAGSLRRPVPGCPLRVSVPRLPAAGAVPGGPRRGWPPLPFRGCRERDARRRSTPGSAAAAVTVCLCHVCAWAGGGAGPRRSQPADTPPSDRRREPNQRLPPARPARSPAQRGSPGRYTWARDSERVPQEGTEREDPPLPPPASACRVVTPNAAAERTVPAGRRSALWPPQSQDANWKEN
ncbi:uncharacterized protein ACIB01_001188 [Guaruba guarouba]